ncbi:MAG: MFS transporter [Sneathiella sp.]|nr:MFS transporter [Sneathiella sp.]
MSIPQDIDEKPYGWVIVAVATICLTAAFGANLTISILIGPFETEFGWSRASISMAYTLLALGAGAGGIIWGAASDRYGAQKIAFFGAIVLSLTMILVSYQTDLQIIYILYFFMGGIGFACLFTPLLALIGLWFDKRKGIAIGVATAGGALGQGLIPYVERLMISEWGWRDAMFYLGVSYLIVLLPILFLLKPPPVLTQAGGALLKSNENSWGMPHNISMPWLAFAGIFCCICMAAPLMHLVPLAMDTGLDPETATSLLVVLMASGIVGRLFFGALADHIGGLKSYFLASVGQTLMVFWFTQTTSLVPLYGLSILFGFAFSGVMTCLLICAREAAPIRIAGFAVAIVGATGWIGMGLGGYQGGFFFDLTGDYVVSYANAALAGGINIAIVSALMWYRQQLVSRLQLT